VQLAIPFIPAFRSPACATTPRKGRDTDTDTAANRRGSFDPHVYTDAIGVPTGCQTDSKPEIKLKQDLNQHSSGGPLPEENVDWINYIYYNQQRFVNYTRDAIKGIAEQLGPTSQMAWENRPALDMMLTEKGGVCVMTEVSYCMYTPNNRAPDGTISKAL
jgi:hypothetical protein